MVVIEWTPDGRSLVIASGDGLQIYTPEGHLTNIQSTSPEVRSASLSPDGQRLAENYGGGEEFHLLLCNSDGSEPQLLDEFAGYPLDFDWTPDSEAILIGGGQPSLRLCRRDGSAGPMFDDDPDWHRGVRRLAVSPDGHLAAVNTENDDNSERCIQIWNLDGTRGPRCSGFTSASSRPVWSHQGDRIAANCMDGRLHVWTSDGRLEFTLPIGGTESSHAIWKPDETQIATSRGDVMQVWDLNGRQRAALRPAEFGKPPWEWVSQLSDKFSDGDSPGLSTTLRFHNSRTGRLEWILAMTAHEAVVRFSPDGRVIEGDPAVVDREFACIVEQPNGAIALVKPSEFAAWHFHDSAKPGGRPE